MRASRKTKPDSNGCGTPFNRHLEQGRIARLLNRMRKNSHVEPENSATFKQKQKAEEILRTFGGMTFRELNRTFARTTPAVLGQMIELLKKTPCSEDLIIRLRGVFRIRERQRRRAVMSGKPVV